MSSLRWLLACVTVSIASLAACYADFEHGDRAGVYVEILDDQPEVPEHGVLVRVLSRGGARIAVAVDDGRATAAGFCLEPADPAMAAMGCTCVPAEHAVTLSVRPVDREALLTVVLLAGTDAGSSCSAATSQVLDAKQIPIVRPGEVTPDAATDAATDALDAQTANAGGV